MNTQELIENNIIIPDKLDKTKAELLLGNKFLCNIKFDINNSNSKTELELIVKFSESGENLDKVIGAILSVKPILSFEYLEGSYGKYFYCRRYTEIVNFNINLVDKFVDKIK